MKVGYRDISIGIRWACKEGTWKNFREAWRGDKRRVWSSVSSNEASREEALIAREKWSGEVRLTGSITWTS